MAGVPVILTNQDDTTPLIGYENLLRDSGATVTYSTQTIGFEASNAYDWLEYSQWLPSASGASWIRASFSSAQSCDYFACAAHTIGANSGSVVLQYSTNGGSSWSNAFTPVVPVGTDVVWQSFDSVSAADWRVLVTATPAAGLGVVSFGSAMQCQRGVTGGFSPPDLAFNDNLTNVVSINGTYLGRSLISEGIQIDVQLENVTEAWAHDTWRPFLIHARQYPFFIQWNNDTYANGSALVWQEGSTSRPSYSQPGFMNVGISTSGTID